MAFNVQGAFNDTLECARAITPAYSRLRVFTVGHNSNGAPAPLDELGVVSLKWSLPAMDTICQPRVSGFPPGFSAVCYFTGRDLFDSLGGAVPIGLISSAVSSTAVDQWLPAVDTASCPALKVANTCAGIHGCLYNYGIAPLAHAPLPLALKAVLWYQVRAWRTRNPRWTRRSYQFLYSQHLHAHSSAHRSCVVVY